MKILSSNLNQPHILQFLANFNDFIMPAYSNSIDKYYADSRNVYKLYLLFACLTKNRKCLRSGYIFLTSQKSAHIMFTTWKGWSFFSSCFYFNVCTQWKVPNEMLKISRQFRESRWPTSLTLQVITWKSSRTTSPDFRVLYRILFEVDLN